MEKKRTAKFWGYLGRFSLVYMTTYTVIALAFLNIQHTLPPSARIALDFYEPYSVGLREATAQLIIGGVIALVLYPFYDMIVKGDRGRLILFAAIWGVAILGSLEPRPGSIEGMIYTETTFAEHFLVLAAGAIQVLLFAWLFLRWERRRAGTAGRPVHEGHEHPRETQNIKGYTARYTLLHVLIYILIGIVFYQVSGYDEALATMEEFKLWRELENLAMPLVILFGQVVRGGVLALLLYPFYSIYMKKPHGWLLLFGLLFGLKVMFIAISIPSTMEEFLQSLQASATGLPEIIAQTLAFSLVFFIWEKRRKKKGVEAVLFATGSVDR